MRVRVRGAVSPTVCAQRISHQTIQLCAGGFELPLRLDFLLFCCRKIDAASQQIRFDRQVRSPPWLWPGFQWLPPNAMPRVRSRARRLPVMSSNSRQKREQDLPFVLLVGLVRHFDPEPSLFPPVAGPPEIPDVLLHGCARLQVVDGRGIVQRRKRKIFSRESPLCEERSEDEDRVVAGQVRLLEIERGR